MKQGSNQQELSQKEGSALLLVAFGGSNTGISQLKAFNFLVKVTHETEDPRLTYDGLMERGLIVAATSDYWSRGYMLTEKAWPFLNRALERFCVPGEWGTSQSPFLWSAHRDILVLLRYAGASGFKVTKGGQIYKRDRQRVCELLEVPSEEQFEFLLRYCHKNDLVALDHEDVLSDTSLAEYWVKSPMALKFLSIYWYLFKYYCMSREFIQLLLTLSKTPKGYWVRYRDLLAFLGLGECRAGIVKFSDMGILEREGEDLVRVSRIGWDILNGGGVISVPPESQTFMVLPNLEVMAPLDLDLSILWCLEQVARRVKADGALTYVLEKQSVAYALAQGLDKGEVLGFLRTHSEVPLPQNVERSIEDWIRSIYRFSVTDVTLLRCESVEAAQVVLGLSGVKRHVIMEVSPTDIIVKRWKKAAVIKAIKRAGLIVEDGILMRDGQAEREASASRDHAEQDEDTGFPWEGRVPSIRDLANITDPSVRPVRPGPKKRSLHRQLTLRDIFG